MGEVVENTHFDILYPSYRISYLNSIIDKLSNILSTHAISIKMNSDKIRICTQPHIKDLYMIIRARDMVQAICRGVSLEDALKLLNEDIVSNIIVIKKYVKDNNVFINRRDRLLGPNDNTIKAIQLLTKTKITVKGKTVTVIGKYKGVEEATKIIIDTMQNIHPIYQIKRLMAIKQIEMDESKKNEDWSKFLPEIKKKIKKNKRV